MTPFKEIFGPYFGPDPSVKNHRLCKYAAWIYICETVYERNAHASRGLTVCEIQAAVRCTSMSVGHLGLLLRGTGNHMVTSWLEIRMVF